MKPKVYVTRIIPEMGLDILREVADIKVWQDELPPPREILLKEVENVDGLVSLLTDKIDAELFDRAKRLKIVSNYAVGFDNIDLDEATKRGIMATNTPGVLTETTADLAFILLMSTARRIVEADKFVRAGKWKTWGPMLMLGQDVYGAKLGLIGLGRIGYAVAKRAKGFDMDVMYYDMFRNEKAEQELGLKFVELEQLLKESDFVSIHVPLTPETKHLINEKTLGFMKKTAILVNTARGPVVDEKALYEALVSNKIAGAGLDVMDPEPPNMDNPLLKLDNVIILPHIASASIATRTKMAVMAAENCVAGLKGEVPPNLLNKQVLDKMKK
ncbi:MAG: glyoxylate reductase [Thermoanaerobacteraceae bacterium]|nr:glyoxylate reductase [Thermoanaerobacteraceae bacterium]RKL63560.1 D-glycerate dehydrogenase [Thermoanaerobacteraceae bacterium SP2]